MSRGTPSMAALLGMIAIAGYQNRDKISKWLGGVAGPQGQGGGLGGLLTGGRAPDQRGASNSWGAPARTGAPQGFDSALETLARQTGLSSDEIRSRLARELPQAAGRTPA